MIITNDLVNNTVLERFLENYSEEKYQTAWEKLQQFKKDFGNDKRLFVESSFDSEWIDEIFCNVLGYSKKQKSREYWITNGNGKQEERIDGIFYDNDLKTVKMVIELKALNTPNLFKKSGSLSPITQGAKYLFQTPESEIAVVSNFNDIVIFTRKEKYRQHWKLFEMSYDRFKEFYLILCSESFFGGLTKLMIEQSTESEKDIDDEFFTLAASIHRSLFNKMKSEYASDLFNKFIALAILEDDSRLPAGLIKTIYSRKTDFDQNLKSHWDVYKFFFQSMKNNKASREYLNIQNSISSLPIWQNISYLGRVSVSKSILDQVVALSNYNLKSMPLDRFFYTLSKKLLNPFDGVTLFSNLELSETHNSFNFYKKYLENGLTPLDECLAFTCGRFYDLNSPLVNLYNQLSTKKIELAKNPIFTISYDSSGFEEWRTIIDRVDLEDSNIVKNILKYLTSVTLLEQDEMNYAVLKFDSEPDKTFLIDGDEIKKSEIKDKIIILTEDEKIKIQDYERVMQPLKKYLNIVDEKYADSYYNPDTCEVVERDSIGNWLESKSYETYTAKVFFKKIFNDIDLILVSKQFQEYLRLKGIDNIDDNTNISQILFSDYMLKPYKELKELRSTIMIYNHALQKLQNDNASELEIMKLEMQLDKFYAQERELLENDRL